MYRFAFFILLSLAASTAFAATKKNAASIDLNASFAEQKAQIERELGDGETYAEISSQDRATVREALNRIASKLDKAGGVENLSEQQKADVFNDQEMVNTLLTKASEDSRQLCSREKRVGSHRVTTQCTTVGQRRRESEESTKALRDNMGIKLPPAG